MIYSIRRITLAKIIDHMFWKKALLWIAGKMKTANIKSSPVEEFT